MITASEKILTDKDKIIFLLSEVVQSFKTRDLQKLLSLHTEDIIVMEPDRPAIVGMPEVKKVFTAAFQNLKQKNISFQLAFKVFEIEIWGERAFVRGQVVKETVNDNNEPEKENGKFICIFKKQADESWLRSHVMANFDAPKNKEELFWDN